jgi:GNAT superfamily N-acetyltransferase
MRPVFKIEVKTDEFTDAIFPTVDYKFEGVSTFEGWEKPSIPDGFSIGLIVGPSGSGKSLLLKEFGREHSINWAKDKAIVSHFETPGDAFERLMAVGLNSAPSWCRPFHVLSNGEQFRASVARKLRDGAILDEFTSVVDRNVAKAASVAIRRYVDKKNLKGLVFASCHSDILPWLRPDWYFDTATGILHDGRLLRRPPIYIKLTKFGKGCTEQKLKLWSGFSKHHYLTESLNPACDVYLATARFEDGPETVVGFASALAQPIGGNNVKDKRKAFREHRTVVLPDFQGLGIGPKISDAVAQYYLDLGKRYFSRTAHVRFGGYRDREGSGWEKTTKYRKLRHDINEKRKRELRLKRVTADGKVIEKGRFADVIGDATRVCFSHEFMGRLNDVTNRGASEERNNRSMENGKAS